MAIAGKVGALYASLPGETPVSFSDETASAVDATYKRYQVDDPNYRYWPPDAAITVKVEGVTQTSGYTLERAGGYVVFDSAQDPADQVTVSGTAVPVELVGAIRQWSLELSGDLADTTVLQQDWKTSLPTLLGWTLSADGLWATGLVRVQPNQLVVVRAMVEPGASVAGFEGWGRLTTGLECDVGDLVTETLEIQGCGPLYWRTS